MRRRRVLLAGLFLALFSLTCLPAIVAAADPDTPRLRSSPFTQSDGERPSGPAPVAGVGRQTAPLTVDALIQLKQLGFSDAEIKDEVLKAALAGGATGQPGQPKPVLAADDDAGVKKLRAAGFSEEMIAFFKQPSGERLPDSLTVEDVVAMVGQGGAAKGKSVEQALDAIKAAAARGVKFRINPARALNLAGRNVPAPVIVALRGKPMTLDVVQRLSGEPMSPAVWSKLVELVGVAKTPLSAAEVSALTRAEVPAEVVALMREVAPTTGPATAGPPKSKPVWEISKPQQPGEYEHPGKAFVLRYPPEWQLLRVIRDSDETYMLTPETTPPAAMDPDKVRTGVAVLVLPLGDTTAFAGKDAVGILRHVLPLMLGSEPGLKPAGEVTSEKLGRGGLDAASITMEGKLTDLAGDFIVRATVAQDEGDLIVIACQAPRQAFDAASQAFEDLKRDSQIGRPRPRRQARSLEAQDIVKKYKASVVSVLGQKPGSPGSYSTGSGFVISKDGYILTNRHVVWDEDKDQACSDFYVEWDDSLKLKRQRAVLIGQVYRLSEFSHTQHGVDIALLKVDPAAVANCEPFELTPMAGGAVEVGDGVVTMGFPKRGVLEGISLTVSRGVVTRFQRGRDGRVNSILTDAVFTHGNSGGPSISLVTGGVIGLNTYLPTPHPTDPAGSASDLAIYFGVVPIDACLREWPVETGLVARQVKPDGSPAGMDFFDAYALSRLYGQRGSPRAAMALARRAIALRPDSPDALCQEGSCLAWQRDDEDLDAAEAIRLRLLILKSLKKALSLDPNHVETLTMLAYEQLRAGEFDDATSYADRALRVAPKSVGPAMLRARIALARDDRATALRYAELAKQVAHGANSGALMLSGSIHYLLGQLDAGRDDYAEAVKLDPASLDAHFGLAKYYQLKNDPESAIAVYRSILVQFDENPLVVAQMGECLYNAKRYKQALAFLLDAWRLFRKNSRPACTEDLYFQMARCLEEVGKDPAETLPDDPLSVYSVCLFFYPAGERNLEAKLAMARLADRWHMPGLATAHLNWAPRGGCRCRPAGCHPRLGCRDQAGPHRPGLSCARPCATSTCPRCCARPSSTKAWRSPSRATPTSGSWPISSARCATARKCSTR